MLGLPPPAHGAATDPAPSRFVVVARPANADPVTTEALARVSGELVAASFDVMTISIPPTADPRGTVESVGLDLKPAAAFAIFPGAPAADGTPTAEIWVSDRLMGRATVERLGVDPSSRDHGAAVLAVRAVELLKASMAELWFSDPQLPPQPAASAHLAPAALPPEPAPVRARGTFGVEAALAFIDHVGGLGGEPCAALKLSLGIHSGVVARLSAFGFGPGWNLSTPNGTAAVHQQVATVDLLATFRADRRLQPYLAVSGGLFHLEIQGTGNSPWTGRTTGTWDLASGGGGGLAVAMGRHAALIADLRALFFWHRPLILVGETSGGQGGLPAVIATMGLLLSL